MAERKRRRASSGGLAKRVALEEATVRVRFLDSTKVYTLAWVELLTMEEVPFEGYEDLIAGVKVMAPWQDRQGNLQYAEAVVLSEENESKEVTSDLDPCASTPGEKGASTCSVTASVATSEGKLTIKDKETRPKSKQTKVKKTCGPKLKETTPKSRAKGKTMSKEKLRTDASKSVEKVIMANISQNEHQELVMDMDTSKETVTNKDGEEKLLHQESAVDMDTSKETVTNKDGEELLHQESAVDMDTSKETVTNKDGEEKLLFGGHASSTPLAPDDHPPTDIDLTSFEVTVQTFPSSHPPENKIKPSSLTPIMQQETPAHSTLTPMPSRSFSCLDQAYFAPDTFGFIPPPISRRHTYPPYNQLHGIGNSSNYSFGYSSSGADEVFDDDSYSVGSSNSYLSQRKSSDGSRFTSPPPSHDLQFVYTHWISPLKVQLDRIESEFQKFTTTLKKQDGSSSPFEGDSGHAPPKRIPKSPAPSLAASDSLETASDKLSIAGAKASSSKQNSNADLPETGCYLGYPQKEKHRVWIDNLSQQRLDEAEKSATDYISLGKLLMQIIFSKELEEAGRWCCTKSKGRQILDQDKLRGIRLHLHKKFLSKLGLKFKGKEEGDKWDSAVKKMNAHIRYRRSAALKEGPKNDPGSGSESELSEAN